jgi:Family of unknown function (DUF6130)
MITLKPVTQNVARALYVAAVMVCGSNAFAQSATDTCKPAKVYPVVRNGARGEHRHRSTRGSATRFTRSGDHPVLRRELHIAPVFGAGALAVSPRVGHVHVTVDDAPWHWADASGTPIICAGCRQARTKC